MPRTRAVGTDRQEDPQAQQIPLRWIAAKPKVEPILVQPASNSTVAADPVAEVAEYYRDRAASFRKRKKLARDDDAADGRLF